MVTVVAKIFLCMGAMYQDNQKILDCFLLLWVKYVHFLFIITHDLVIKNQKNQQREWLCLMN